MRRRAIAIVLACAALAVVSSAGAATTSIAFSGEVQFVTGTPPGGIAPGDPVTGEIAYADGSSSVFPLCATDHMYIFTPGLAHGVQARIRSQAFWAPLFSIRLVNDVTCTLDSICVGGTGVDLLWVSGAAPIAALAGDAAYLFIEFTDCSAPFDLLTSTALPTASANFDFASASESSGRVANADYSWTVYFSVDSATNRASAVESQTWSAIKRLYSAP